MTEIRSLTAELQQQQQQTSDQRKIQNATDSGIESTESRDGGGDIGSKHDKWMKQLSEQRQRYYDNVQQLQACIRNRQPLTFQCECQHQPEPIRVNCATQTVRKHLQILKYLLTPGIFLRLFLRVYFKIFILGMGKSLRFLGNSFMILCEL